MVRHHPPNGRAVVDPAEGGGKEPGVTR
jgi:hypothetical protein